MCVTGDVTHCEGERAQAEVDAIKAKEEDGDGERERPQSGDKHVTGGVAVEGGKEGEDSGEGMFYDVSVACFFWPFAGQ